jgi:amidase
MKDIIFSTATALACAIREKQVSAMEVLEAHLAHIAKHNPKLNAIVLLDEKGAKKRAREADKALARGEVWGPLHGVPVTLKDMHSVAGMLSPWAGHPDYANRIPTEDSAMPAKLRGAGAVILGLTNAHLLDNNIFGRTNNPWDVERSPSGSSAGSAAAVAAGLSPLDIGNDSLASILGPAIWCGVFGMRPTEHRLSNAGGKVFGTPHTWQPFTVSGPLARSVEDLELALQVISGPDGRDMDVPPIPWREATGVKLRGLRIAWSHTFPKMPLAKDIHDSIESLVAELARLGAHIEQTMPDLDYIKEHDLAWQFMRFTWEDLFRANSMMAQDEPPLRLDAFYKAVVQREELVRTWEQFFTQWDVFLCPVWVTTADLHTDTQAIVNGKAYTEQEVSPSAQSISPLTGLPSVVIPVGLDAQGLPIGLQLIGRRWQDERLLAIAKLASEAAGGFRKPPGY